MWDVVDNFLNNLGFTALSGFIKFYRNREQLIKNFTEGKKEIASIGKFQANMFQKYVKNPDPLLKDLVTYGPEYFAYVIPEEAIPEAKRFFIQLGRTLEIKEAMKQDAMLKKVASYGGELGEIGKL